MDGKYIGWNADLAKRFEDLYKLARHNGWSSFKFEGHEWDTNYAGYLIEYLHMQFKF